MNGWKWVPVEPTKEQRLAVCMHPDLASALYSSMIKAAPVPPAGEVEVLAWGDIGPGSDNNRKIFTKWTPEAEEYHRCAYPLTELVDRAHVTRLTAENARLQAEVRRMEGDIYIFQNEYVRDSELEDVQSDLTKARELVRWLYTSAEVKQVGTVMMENAREFIADQSAPAANFIACKVDESCGLGGGNGTDE